jgi:hypothetical protein
MIRAERLYKELLNKNTPQKYSFDHDMTFSDKPHHEQTPNFEDAKIKPKE